MPLVGPGGELRRERERRGPYAAQLDRQREQVRSFASASASASASSSHAARTPPLPLPFALRSARLGCR